MINDDSKVKVVYTSDMGRLCPDCGKPTAGCVCRKGKPRSQPAANRPPADGIVRVGRETKGRKGAGVTVVTGVPGNDDELKRVAGELKKKCGAGGTLKDGVIEIQGDNRDRVTAELEKMGFKVKRSGG